MPWPGRGARCKTHVRHPHVFVCFVSHVGRIVKQLHITDKTAAVAQLYLAKCTRAYVQYGADLVLTMDETFWPLLPKQNKLVCTRGGVDRAASKTNDKAGVTLTVTVAADGHKLPLYFVAKGKSLVCTEKFEVKRPHRVYYTKSGWMRHEIMPHYLERIVNEYTQGKPCALLLDSYKAHIKLPVYEKAKELNIELIVVPCCMTATLSPLDVGVNGVLKSIYSRDWRRVRLFGDDTAEVTMPYATAADLAQQAYGKVKPSVVKSSFLKATQLPPARTLTMLELAANEEKCRLDVEKNNAKDEDEKKETSVAEPSRRSFLTRSNNAC
jgi:hypothetical protein